MKNCFEKLLIILLTLTLAGCGLEAKDCELGKTVYIDGLFDEEVTVIDKNDENDTCEVRLANGDTKWVEASDLMSPLGKEAEDYAEEKLVETAIKCTFTDECKKSSDSNTAQDKDK